MTNLKKECIKDAYLKKSIIKTKSEILESMDDFECEFINDSIKNEYFVKSYKI